MFEHVLQPYCISFLFFSVLLSWNCYVCLAPHTCKTLLSFVLFSLSLLSLTLLVVPPFPKVEMMTLTFTDKPEISFFFYLHFVFALLLLHNEPAHLPILLVFVPCDHGMQPTVLQKFHIHPVLGTPKFIFTIPNVRSMPFL